MEEQKTFSEKVLEFNDWLSNRTIELPNNYKICNPFKSKEKAKINKIASLFYNKYYNDTEKRYLILGSSPARKGTTVTGIPFEDANHLYKETNIKMENFYINKVSSNFLYEVMEQYGGCQQFYKDFYMNFVCPLGITNINEKGNEINSNYYENKKLENALSDFIVESLKKQIALGINTSVCFCIGSGQNFKFLTKINEKYKLFDKIIALEHPRYIMQYNSKEKDKYLQKYITTLVNKQEE